jgi:hypothetical protein
VEHRRWLSRCRHQTRRDAGSSHDLGATDQTLLERLEQTIFNNRKLRWSVVQRGFWLDALRCPKMLINFTATEGAGEHCEMTNRSLLNGRVLDWLDDILA